MSPWRVVGLAALLPTALGAQAISGRVVDAASGRPLFGAEVVIEGGSGSVRTDSSGRWRLDIGGPTRVRVRHPGHAFRDVLLSAGTSPLTIMLEPLALSLDAIVVTASRREQKLADVAVETAIIGPAVLQRSGAPDLATALADQSGLQLDGGTPAGAGVQLRGFDSRRVLVLLDGQPLVGRVAGNFDLSRLPVSLIERVEVVKGPQSTLYGSDALGGVINVITRRAEAEGWAAGLATSGGTQGRLEGSGDLLWRRGVLGIAADAGARTLDLAPGVSGDNGTYARRANAMGSVTWDATSRSRALASLLTVVERQRYRTGQLYRFADNTQVAARVGFERSLTSGRLSGTVHASTFDHLSRASTLDAPVSSSGERDRQALWQGELLWNTRLRHTDVDLGTSLRREDITADRVLGRRRGLSGVEPFVQATYARGPLTLVPGVRVTWSDAWGDFVAPRLAAMWRPVPALALRASAGRGFRAPDFKELYLRFVNAAAGYAVDGNPDLRPERSTSLSLGGDYTGQRLWGTESAYHNAYRDFIETGEQDAAGTFTYQNLDRGWMRGVELESGVFVGAWQAEAGADLLRTRDRASGTPLLGRARTTARASVSGPVPLGASGSASLVYTGRTPVDRDASGRAVDRGGWARLDARLTRPLPSGLRWSVGVTNLLDRRMGTAWPGFTGRQLVTTVEWRGGPVQR